MNQPPLNFLGFTIFEPVTVLTDFILCTFCLLFAYKMQKQNTKIWSFFFISMAIATFTGGLGHGMYDHEKSDLKMISSVFGIITVFFGSIASTKFIFNKYLRKFITTVICIKLLIFLFLITNNNDIKIVAIYGILGFLFIVAPIHLNPAIRKNTGSKLMLYGISVNAVAGVVHGLSISPHKWFNQNDLSHLVMLFGLYLFSKAASQLKLEEPQVIESLADVNSSSENAST